MPMKQQQEECEECEDWLTTYADAITLLMAFFVMMVSMSKINIPLYEEVRAGIQNEIGKKDTESPMEIMKLDIQEVVMTNKADEAVEVTQDDRGVVIELASAAFYKPGSADLREEALPVLQNIALTLAAPKYDAFIIEIEGHTDDDPISTARYPSNWELSAGRAAGVVRFLITAGFEAERLKATAFAETQPKVPNRDIDGNPIPENQAKNRRVVVRVYPETLEQRTERLAREAAYENYGKGGGGPSLTPSTVMPGVQAPTREDGSVQPGEPGQPPLQEGAPAGQ